MAPITPRSLVASSPGLYSPPAVYHAINEVVHRPDASMEDVGAAIMQDPSIAARVLQLANSPLFGGARRIETVSEAVMRIGIAQITAIVHASVVVARFHGLPVHILNLEDFWKHSIAVGMAAQLLAKPKIKGKTERFFLMGLMHDLGRLIMIHQMPDRMTQVFGMATQSRKPLYQLEKEEFGFDHTDVGRALFDLWEMPLSMAECIANHHRWATITEHPFECAVVHIADILAHSLELGCSGELCVPPINKACWDELGVPVGNLASIANEVETAFIQVVTALLPPETKKTSPAHKTR